MIGNRVWADDFNRASLGVGTIYSDDSGTYSISSNTLACSTSNQRALNTTSAAHPPIANVRIRFRRASATFDGGILARSNVSGLTSSVGNAYIINPFGTQVDVIRRNAGINNAVGTIAGITYANGDLIDVDVIGTGAVVHFAVWKNIYQLLGTLQDISGARILVPGQTGFLGFNLNSRYDDFEVFDLLDKTPHGLRAPRPGRGPYSIGRLYRPWPLVVTSTVSSGITGSLAATDDADVAAVEGAVTVAGELSAQDTVDTAAVAADVIVQGALAATEGADTAAVDAGVIVNADLSASESGPDTAAVAGDVTVQGDLAATDPVDTASIIGEGSTLEPIEGDLAATDGADAAALDASVLVSGALASVDGGDTAAVSGGVTVQADLSATDARDTSAISGTISQPFEGDLDAHEDSPDVASIEGSITGGVVTAAEAIALIKAREVRRSAIVDKYGRYAKRPEDIAEVWLEFLDLSQGAISAKQNKALTRADREHIAAGGSLPIDTEGKSNA